MKKLFISLKVQQGDYTHVHRALYETDCKDINFAGLWYASHYYGDYSKRQNNDWWLYFNGDIAVKLSKVIELSNEEYKLMYKLYYDANYSKPTNDYFKVVHTGYSEEVHREEIQIYAGENGNIFIHRDEDKLGFIIDVYGQTDLADTMTVWEDDLIGDYD